MPDTPPIKQGGSLLVLGLAGSLALLASVVLFFLSLGFFGIVMLVVAGVIGYGLLHYVLWGWWLSRIIREEVEAENETDAANVRSGGRGDP